MELFKLLLSVAITIVVLLILLPVCFRISGFYNYNLFCVDFAPTDYSGLEHDLIYSFCYICSLEDKGIHRECPQYFSVSVQGIYFLTVQCTCFDNLPLEINGACEFPDGCGKEGCVVNRPLYCQSDETLYWSLILRSQFTIPSWSLITWFVSVGQLGLHNTIGE